MEEEKEVWKDVIGYEGVYQVSNHGRFKSLDRLIRQWNGQANIERSHKGRIIKLVNNGVGYYQANLVLDGVTNKKYIHRLVYETFKSIIPDDLNINHIDHDKSNNNISNLELVTHKENMVKMVEFYGTTKEIKKCGCGEEINHYSKQCRKCESIDRLIDGCMSRPSLGTLLKDVYTIGYRATGKKYGVSDNSIRKWVLSWHKIMDTNFNEQT